MKYSNVLYGCVILLLVLAGCIGDLPEDRDISSNNSSMNNNSNKSLIGTTHLASAEIISKEKALSLTGNAEINRSYVEANLYYIDSEGNWWRASPNGTILRPAPNGSDTVVAGSEVPSQDKTKYVWKIEVSGKASQPGMGGAETEIVNATSGEQDYGITVP
ncbi:MAG: hypothetical protein SXQ77_07465 [Halobacteria archaeon]|nr:hypothetical protein [Halobacteria archaeon]